MSERKPRPLALLEAKTRQFLLMVGFGFMAYVGGSLFSASLIMRVRDRVLSADSAIVAFVVQALVSRLWILAVFPLLVHLASRFLELPVWRTAIIGALTGEIFYSAIQIASMGADEAFSDWLQDATRLGTLVAGIFLTVWAGKLGSAWAANRQKLADAAASGRKAQYDEFLAASTALADRREASPIVAAPPAAGVPAPEPVGAVVPELPLPEPEKPKRG